MPLIIESCHADSRVALLHCSSKAHSAYQSLTLISCCVINETRFRVDGFKLKLSA